MNTKEETVVDLLTAELDKLTTPRKVPAVSSVNTVTDFTGEKEGGEAEPTLSDRTMALLRGLVLIFRHHGAPEKIIGCLETQVTSYLSICPNEEEWVKSVKHFLTYPLAKYLRNEPPKSTGRDFHAVGDLKKWLKQRLICFNRKNTHLWYSWFQAKRATLPMSESIVDKTYEDHFAALTRDDDGQDDVIEAILGDPTFQLVLKSVADEVANTDFDSFVRRQPSTNASFECSRRLGGQQQELLNICHEEPYDVPRDSELLKMEWFPVRFGRKVQTNVCLETRERYGRDQWGNLMSVRELLVPSLKEKEVSCTIQAVLEPMKVRVISKGEALPYYTMRPLQKSLWNALRRIPCFRLIGRPFCPTDICDLKKRADSTDEWFSVDYSAATDGLSWKYSGQILEHCISLLPQQFQATAMSVLGPHRLHYPSKERGAAPIFKGVMRRGQLMGSILSFPILCLANLGVYLYANRERFQKWNISDILNHVLINGDDMLYAAPADLWEEHIRAGKATGLNMSVGKSYHHPIYANVNSTSIHCDLRKNETPWQIDFLNVGLFFGQHKVQGERGHDISSGDTSSGLVTIIPQMLKGCLPNRGKDLLSMYLARHSEAISRETAVLCDTGIWNKEMNGKTMSRNLFLPLSIGGMGIVPPAGFKFKVTSRQKILAKVLRQRVTCSTCTQLPLGGMGKCETRRYTVEYPTGHHTVEEYLVTPVPGYEVIKWEEVQSSPWAQKAVGSVADRYVLTGVTMPSRREWNALKIGFIPMGKNKVTLIA